MMFSDREGPLLWSHHGNGTAAKTLQWQWRKKGGRAVVRQTERRWIQELVERKSCNKIRLCREGGVMAESWSRRWVVGIDDNRISQCALPGEPCGFSAMLVKPEINHNCSIPCTFIHSHFWIFNEFSKKKKNLHIIHHFKSFTKKCELPTDLHGLMLQVDYLRWQMSIVLCYHLCKCAYTGELELQRCDRQDKC